MMETSTEHLEMNGQMSNGNGSVSEPCYENNMNRKLYKREPAHRIFVNRSLHLEKIKFFGFDMDYTLAAYKSPEYESMGFSMLRDRLVSIGYPTAIKDFEYDPTFAARGLWFDKTYGNFLKVDSYGNILVCIHGFKFLKPYEITQFYPNKFIQLDENRLFVLNTLFNLPETYMLACLIDYFGSSDEFQQEDTGVKSGDLVMSYKSIFQDVRASVDWMHFAGALKQETIKNIEKYVIKDERLPVMFDRFKEHGKKTMLITNSEYYYTDRVMDYLFSGYSEEEDKKPWTSYFDYIVVDAKKPIFFRDGTILRQVDTKTGALKIGHHTGPLKQGHVYSGGSCDVLSEMIGAKGKDVLYVGDHIYGDILKSKKERGWRTFLMVPELADELHVWTSKRSLFDRLETLERQLGQLYKNLDSSAVEIPDTRHIKKSLREVTHEMDLSYGMLGSVFRSGSRLTFFAAQVQRYADIYGATFLNLLHYPFSYMFRAPPMLMPHESTVDHTLLFNGTQSFVRSRNKEETELPKTKKPRVEMCETLTHSRPTTPVKLTHYHDEDDSDSDSDLSTDKSS